MKAFAFLLVVGLLMFAFCVVLLLGLYLLLRDVEPTFGDVTADVVLFWNNIGLLLILIGSIGLLADRAYDRVKKSRAHRCPDIPDRYPEIPGSAF